MKKFYIVALVLLTLLPMTSCDSMDKKGALYVSSIGIVGEIIVVMDDEQWKGSVGKMLKAVLQRRLPNLIKKEHRFDLVHKTPNQFFGTIKRRRNVIFLTLLDDNSVGGKSMKGYFNKETLDKVKKNPDKFMITKEDVYAADQNVLYLFGKNEKDILAKLKKNSAKLFKYCELKDKSLIEKNLYGRNEAEQLSKFINNKYGIQLRIPVGFKKVVSDSNFLWIRSLGSRVDKSILIKKLPYSSEKMFDEENIIKLRDNFGKNNMFDPEPANSGRDTIYVLTQEEFPAKGKLATKNLTLSTNFAREYRGYWKVSTGTMGGPFVSYAVLANNKKDFYYIEGMLKAPKVKYQKEFLLELETILKSVKFSE